MAGLGPRVHEQAQKTNLCRVRPQIWSERPHLRHIGSQAHSTAASATGVDASGCKLVNVAEQLRLADTRIAYQQYIDLTAYPAP